MKPIDHAKRLAWLLACFFAGLLIAAIGHSVSGNPVWYVAIPAMIALGWLFVADPTECLPKEPVPPRDRPG